MPTTIALWLIFLAAEYGINNTRYQKGFSLFELMLVIFIGSVLLTIGVPAMTRVGEINRMAFSVNEINGSLHLARSEAVKRRGIVSICASENWDAAEPSCGEGASFESGWIVFLDAPRDEDPNLSLDDDDILLQTHAPLPDRIVFSAADASDPIEGAPLFISFADTGYPILDIGDDNAIFNIQLCDDRNDESVGNVAAGRWIQIGPTGRPQMHREPAALASDGNPNDGCVPEGS